MWLVSKVKFPIFLVFLLLFVFAYSSYAEETNQDSIITTKQIYQIKSWLGNEWLNEEDKPIP